jgi:hypothetical protein
VSHRDERTRLRFANRQVNVSLDAQLVKFRAPIALRWNRAQRDNRLLLVMVEPLDVVRLERGQRRVNQNDVGIERRCIAEDVRAI